MLNQNNDLVTIENPRAELNLLYQCLKATSDMTKND